MKNKTTIAEDHNLIMLQAFPFLSRSNANYADDPIEEKG